MQKDIIHLPQKVCRRFVGNVNFFLSPCVRLSDMVQFSVACYTFKQEVTFLTYSYGYLLRVLHWCTDQSMTAALENGEKVQLSGFGTFEVKEREARIGRNPHTKEAIEIPATKVPVFKPSKALKDNVVK